jgi:ankyrin repeat protein
MTSVWHSVEIAWKGSATRKLGRCWRLASTECAQPYNDDNHLLWPDFPQPPLFHLYLREQGIAAFGYALVSFPPLLLMHYSCDNLYRPVLNISRQALLAEQGSIRMESTSDSHESSLDDYFTDGVESAAEYDDDDDCEDDWDDSDVCVEEDEINPDRTKNRAADRDAEPLKDFRYDDEGAIYADGHAIRLLRLESGTGPIQACLFKAFLHKSENGMPYEALSYTWGSNEKTRKMVLNGERFMVTQNLYSALQYLRFKDEDRILWVDAICIDQSHIAERNHQVGHMASIYHDADRVLFWLGEPTGDTDFLMSSLIRLQERASDSPNLTHEKTHDSRWRSLWNEGLLYEDLPVLLRGLISLLGRPWFTRSWILQEVCFAETSVIACGTKAIAAQLFAHAPWLLDLNPEAHCKAVLDMMPGATRSTRTFLSGRETRNFYSLLRRFYKSEAIDPRDQVYALLSMATDANMAGFPRIDYGKKFEEVVDSIFAYLFPKSWIRSGRSHSYQSLSAFVEDFPRLREAEIDAKDDNVLLRVRLLDDTELTQLRLQEGFRIAVQTGNAQLLRNLLKFPNIDLNENIGLQEVESRGPGSGRLLSPIWAAAASGFTDVVKLLAQDYRLNINANLLSCLQPFQRVVELDSESIVNIPLDARAGSNQTFIDSKGTKHSQIPLSYAGEKGSEAVIKLLVDIANAKIDLNDDSGRNSILYAAESGHQALVKLLFEAGQVDVDSNDKDSQTPLLYAAKNGHEAVVKLLLQTRQADANSKNEEDQTALTSAIGNGHDGVVKLLLDTDQVDVYSKSEDGQTAFELAMNNGYEGVVKLVLQVDTNLRDKYGQQALQWAAKHRYEAVVKLLLDTGQVNTNSKDDQGQTALQLAAERGYEDIVRSLLDTGQVDANSKDDQGQTALHLAAKHGHEDVVKLLLDTGQVDATLRNQNGQTALLLAARYGYIYVVKSLLDTGQVNTNSKDDLGHTALQLAAERGYEDIVRSLLDTGQVDANLKDDQGQTALHLAAERGHEVVVKLILDTGQVDATLRNQNGQTALHLAARYGYTYVVKLLLDAGQVNTNSKDGQGQTALQLAAERGYEDIVRSLLDMGQVDVNSKNDQDQTALQLAAERGREAVVKLLLDAGQVDTNSKDDQGQTALHLAAERGHEVVVKLILDTGQVDANLKNKEGRTALFLATINRHEAVVRLLLSSGQVDANLKDSEGRTALQFFPWKKNEAITKLLGLFTSY